VKELAPGRGQGLPPEGSAALYFAFKAPGSELACFLKEGIQSRYRPHFFLRVEPLFELLVLVQILLSVCFYLARGFADFKRPGPRPKFPERCLLLWLVV
jgi:hypothetical protein